MRVKLCLTSAALVGLFLVGQYAVGQTGFGTLSRSADVKKQAEAWLKKATNNPAKLEQFNQIWSRSDRSALDNLGDTFALANADAARLLGEVRNLQTTPSITAPAFLTESKDSFFRNNLGLIVARNLTSRRLFEPALELLDGVEADAVVDPSSYLFYRAVCEHGTLRREDAIKTIGRLLQETVDSPERYRIIGTLMLLDIETWRKDLYNVARLMDNSGRRLDVGAGGPVTQKIQKQIVARLDEMIMALETQARKLKPGGGC